MAIPNNYICDGQLNIWDYLATTKEESEEICESKKLCEHEVNDAICEGCKWRNWESRYLEVDEDGSTWVYCCPGTACANWKNGTPRNLAFMSEYMSLPEYDFEERTEFPDCYNKDFLPPLPLIIEWINDIYELGIVEDKCDWDESIEHYYTKKLSRGVLALYDDHYSTGERQRFVSVDYNASKSGFGSPCDNLARVFRAIDTALKMDEKEKHQKKEKVDPYA